MIKHFMTVMLTVAAILVSMIPVYATESESNVLAQGTFGEEDNLTWVLENTGLLVISGTGRMKDVYVQDYPWYEYAGQVTAVRVEDGVENIGEFIFEEYDALETVTIADTVTQIGRYAFQFCDVLDTVYMPASLTEIGCDAFFRCPLLRCVHIADVQTWFTVVLHNAFANPFCNGADLFSDDKIVCELSVPETVTQIHDYLFYGCTSLTSFYCHDALTAVGTAAFYGCTALQRLVLPAGVSQLGEKAFYGCSSLPFVRVPDGIAQLSASVFSQCTSLRCVALSENLQEAQPDSFDGCDAMRFVLYDGTQEQWDNAIGLHIPFDPQRQTLYTQVGTNYLFEDFCLYDQSGTQLLVCAAVQRFLKLEDHITMIDEQAFDGISQNFLLIVPPSLSENCALPCYTAQDLMVRDGAVYTKDETTLLYVQPGNSTSSFAVPASVTKIGDFAFSDCVYLQNVTLHDRIERIGQGAFAGCRNLVSVQLPDGVTELAEDLFYACSSLTDVAFSPQLTTIGASVFRGCRRLSGVSLPQSVTAIGVSAFAGCENFENISLPEQVQVLADGLFENCKRLSCISFSETLTSVGNAVFADCNALATVSFPETLTGIGENAFRHCVSLTQVKLPDSLTVLDNGIFRGCYQLSDINIPRGLCAIGDYAFYDCISLSRFAFPDTVTHIGEYAFYGCESFSEVVLPSQLTALENGVLMACIMMNKLTLPEGLQTIGEEALRYCQTLTALYIPATVTSLSASAFANCNMLKKIYFGGNEEQWTAIAPDERSGIEIYFEHTHIPGKWHVILPPRSDKKGIAENNCMLCGAVSTGEIDETPFNSNEKATVDMNGRISVVKPLTAEELLLQAGEGAQLVDSKGESVAMQALVGTGMVLTLADGIQYEVLVAGDSNGDGLIDSVDARFSLRLAVGLAVAAETSAKYCACDVDDYVGVTASDARKILRVAVGLDELSARKR